MAGHILPAVNPSGAVYAATAGAQFDGSTTYLSKSAEIVNGTTSGIISFWLKKSSWVNGECVLSAMDGVGNSVYGTSVFAFGGGLSISGIALPTTSQILAGTVSFISFPNLANNEWHHFLASWNNTTNIGSVYVDGMFATNMVDEGFILPLPTFGVPAAWRIGGNIAAGSNLYTGGIAELYLSTGTYLDLSVLANRRKFITASNRPAFLGVNGTLPTGTEAEMYFKGSGTGFNVNSGSGGNFTTTGALTTPTTTPSSP